MARAVIEGVAFALSEVYAEFARLGFKVDDIHVTGGGARSGLWRQVLADVLRRRIFYAGGDGTLGSAMVAAVGLGVHADFEAAMRHMVHPLAQCEPDEAHARQYQVGLEAFARGRDAVSRAGQPESRDGC
jgi:xylulokinase